MRQRIMTVLVAVVAGGSAAAFGGASASAVAVNPFPGGTEVYFDNGESAAIANLNLGHALSQVAVAWSPGAKAMLGEGITEHARWAGESPTGGVSIEVYGSFLRPELVTVTTLRG
ncbi:MULTISPECIES: hypothetical protein [Nocardia]|jgi:hypothetical protein|uniref:hypothetical protein n=1 Tax=Nocardia abscessus TaxID=120957 RepID=UPI0018943458|nr:hypothetical protein [Nocardia abscessus]MBF6473935.1 hypothetical protein [Nocardia abscessus]